MNNVNDGKPHFAWEYTPEGHSCDYCGEDVSDFYRTNFTLLVFHPFDDCNEEVEYFCSQECLIKRQQECHYT